MADALGTLYAPLMVLSGVASICGNLLLLLVLLLNKELQTDTLGLTVSFCISDLALGLSTIPLGAYNSLTRPSCYSSEGAFCQGSGFLFLLLQTSSVHSLAWATVDKFTEICFALSYHAMWTLGRSRAMLVLVWAFCLATAASPLLGFGGYAYSESRFLCCLNFTTENRLFVALWMSVGVAAPILTVCSLYGYIVYVAGKQARRGTFMCNELHCYYVPANNYLRSSVVMVSTSVCLLVCWLPYISVGLYETFSGQQSPAVISALSTWLVLTSAALNPWITCMTQIRYRAAVLQSVYRFIQMCSGTPLVSRPQSSALHPDTANRVSTTTTVATRLPSSPTAETPTAEIHRSPV
ncbi:adenosine receptor A3 [Cebidichthys violaceus]|uniref:adenosine receptor A3 n=1 Tax=Cebidichthys violaceus TaxID=271503 RepID=UPI0035C9C823